MVAGIVLGVMMSAVAALVAGCIYLEHKYPEIQDRLRYEMEAGRNDKEMDFPIPLWR